MIVRTGLVKVTIKYDDAVFHMVELDTKEEANLAVEAVNNPGAAIKGKFVKGVVSWEKVEDAVGPLPCTEENKETVFDCNKEMMENVIQQYLDAVEKKKESEKKILKSGDPGTLNENKSTVRPVST